MIRRSDVQTLHAALNAGLSVIVTEEAVVWETEERRRRRTWWERLFTRPWHPLVIRNVPKPAILQLDGKLFVHPAAVAQLERFL